MRTLHTWCAGASPMPRTKQTHTPEDRLTRFDSLSPFLPLFGYTVRALLMECIEKGHSEHHLVFWELVQTFKMMDPADQTSIDRDANFLYENFIKTGMDQQINITEEQRLEVHDALNDCNVNMFMPSEQTAIDLIKGNFYYKFIESDSYTTAMETRNKAGKKAAKRDSKKAGGGGGGGGCTIC
jgi:hypothetical protein